MQNQIDELAEKVKGMVSEGSWDMLNDALGVVEERINKLSSRVELLGTTMGRAFDRVSDLTKRVSYTEDTMNERLDKINERIDKLANAIDVIAVSCAKSDAILAQELDHLVKVANRGE